MKSQEFSDRVTRKKSALLKLAEALGNISEACSRKGISRTMYYEYKRRFQTYGLKGLKNLAPIHHNHPQTTPPKVVGRTLKLSFAHPSWGCNRLSDALKLEGSYVSAPKVQEILNDHGIGTRHYRWLKLRNQCWSNKTNLSPEQNTFLEEQIPRSKESTPNFPPKRAKIYTRKPHSKDPVGDFSGQSHWDELNSSEWKHHQLINDFFRIRHDTKSDFINQIHRQAAIFYKQNSFSEEAINHALAGKDYCKAAQWIEEIARSVLLVNGDTQTLIDWVEQLPTDIISKQPGLEMVYAWTLVFAGRNSQAINFLDTIENHFSSKSLKNQWIAGEIAVLRANIAETKGDTSQLKMQAMFASEYLPKDYLLLRSFITWHLGQALRYSGNAKAAYRVFSEASRLAGTAGNLCTHFIAASNAIDRLVELGQLRQAASAYTELHDKADKNNLLTPPFLGESFVQLGDLYREWNDLEQAENLVIKGLGLAKRTNFVGHLINGYITNARIRTAKGDFKSAGKNLESALEVANSLEVDTVIEKTKAWVARIQLCQGNLTEVETWTRNQLTFNSDAPIEYNDEERYLVYVRFLICKARKEKDSSIIMQADKILLKMLNNVNASGRIYQKIKILILRSILLSIYPSEPFKGCTKSLDKFQKRPSALACLKTALLLAEPQGLIRTFLDEGDSLSPLLERITKKKSFLSVNVRHYAFYLLQLFPQKKDAGEASFRPLSTREIQVLQIVAQGYSNQDIAQQLFISLGTVKMHMSHIFNKLEVENRIKAVTQARILHLIL